MIVQPIGFIKHIKGKKFVQLTYTIMRKKKLKTSEKKKKKNGIIDSLVPDSENLFFINTRVSYPF